MVVLILFLQLSCGAVLHCNMWSQLHYDCSYAMAWAVTSLSLRRPRFDRRPVCVGFVVDKLAVEQVFLQVFQLRHVIIIPPMLHALLSFICHRCYIILQLMASLDKTFLLFHSIAYKRTNL
jgi:hypothetical protein